MEVDEGVKPLPLNTSPQALTTSATSEELLNLEYEGLHSICFSCGRYGHMSTSCPSIISMILHPDYKKLQILMTKILTKKSFGILKYQQ